MSVRFRQGARADLIEIALHIGSENFQRAQSQVARLRQRCAILEKHPLAGRLRPEVGDGIRSLSERPYVIFYVVSGDNIDVVAIVHAARDLPSALARRLED